MKFKNNICMKVIVLLILMVVSIHFDNVSARTGVECSLDDDSIDYSMCDTVSINSLDNIDKLSLFERINNIFIRSVEISDISFLNVIDDELDSIDISNSKVNLDNFDVKVRNIFISSTIIEDSDLSGLASDVSLVFLGIEDSLVTDLSSISSLSDLPNFTELTFSCNDISIINLNPVMSLKRLQKVDFNGLEHNVTSELLEFISSNNITATTNLNLGISYMERLKAIIDELGVMEMDDSEAIKKIVSYVVDTIEYTNDHHGYEGINAPLNGYGVCADYSLLTDALLELAGFKSLKIGGFAFSEDGSPHAWNYVYLNGVWYGVDSTWLDHPNDSFNEFFMDDLNSDDWSRSHYPHNPMMSEYIPTITVDLRSNIGVDIDSIRLSGSSKINMDKIPKVDGYSIVGLYYDSSFLRKVAEDIINRDQVLYVKYDKIDNPNTSNNLFVVLFGMAIISFGYLIYRRKKMVS